MSDPYIGEIRMFGGNFAPAGWAFCWGQLLPISENDTLFNIIGTTYGGDGQETFGLPNLASRFPQHRPASTSPGATGGVEAVTLSTVQLPVHNHALLATTALANKGTPGNVTVAQAPTVQVYAEDDPLVAMAPEALAAAGGSQPHENMHPFLVINFIISLFGIFPSQT